MTEQLEALIEAILSSDPEIEHGGTEPGIRKGTRAVSVDDDPDDLGVGFILLTWENDSDLPTAWHEAGAPQFETAATAVDLATDWLSGSGRVVSGAR